MAHGSIHHGNQLMATLPADVLRRLEPHLEPFELRARQVLYEPGDRVRHAILPENGMLSVVNVMQDGRSIEMGTIGHEGMSGVPALWGIDFVPYRCIVQIAGSALRIKCADLLQAAVRRTPLLQLTMRYYVAFTS